MHSIAYQEIDFHPQSIADYKTRLFKWQGQIYRGIGSERASFFQELFDDGTIQQLVDRELLVESELVALEVDEFDIVVKHQVIPFASYAIEWSAAMIKDAVLTLLDFGIELAKRGYALEDGHLKNVLFDGSKPVFVDLGSIRPLDEYVHYSRWDAYDQFCQTCLYPLMLMAQGKDRVARLLMVDNDGIFKADLLLLTQDSKLFARLANPPIITRLQLALRQILPPAYLKLLKQNLHSISSFFSQRYKTDNSPSRLGEQLKREAYLKLLQRARQDVENISIQPSEDESDNLSQDFNAFFSNRDGWTAKQINVDKIISELKPASVLDIGCGLGFYSKLAAILGSKVVAFDKDVSVITQLYYDSRCEKDALDILPLLMDFTQPTPARGLGDYLFTSAIERFPCELVLGLGIIHHLVCDQHPQFEQAVEGFAQFSKRWLLVEFIPPEDEEFIQLQFPRHSWYTLDNFMNVLKQWFRNCTILPSYPECRVLILCEK